MNGGIFVLYSIDCQAELHGRRHHHIIFVYGLAYSRARHGVIALKITMQPTSSFFLCVVQRTHLVNLRSFPPAVRDRASGDEISQPKQDQRFYTADRPQTELAFYLQFVLS
jgi:hypothetical protein